MLEVVHGFALADVRDLRLFCFYLTRALLCHIFWLCRVDCLNNELKQLPRSSGDDVHYNSILSCCFPRWFFLNPPIFTRWQQTMRLRAPNLDHLVFQNSFTFTKSCNSRTKIPPKAGTLPHLHICIRFWSKFVFLENQSGSRLGLHGPLCILYKFQVLDSCGRESWIIKEPTNFLSSLHCKRSNLATM